MSDRRRILGPLGMIHPNIPHTQPSTTSTTKSSSSIPSFFLKHSVITNANGSAYLEINNTIIEVSIFGPRPIRGSFIDRATLSIECKFLPNISPQPQSNIFNDGSKNIRTGMTNVEHKLSNYLESCFLPCLVLEKYPKSTIDIQVSIISVDKEMLNDDDGRTNNDNSSLLWLCQWMVCCCSLALVDSGIEMRDIVSSGQVRYTKSGKVLINPIGNTTNEKEEDDEEEGVDALVSFMNLKNDEIVGIWFESNDDEKVPLDESQMEKLIEECNKMSKIVRANINSYLINSV